MKVQKAKTLDQIYEEVKDKDLVITAEASLADALKRKLDETKIGRFAVTPQRKAYGDELAEEDFKRDIFLRLVNEEGLGWKQASYLLGNAISCWKNTGELEKIRDHGFDGEAMEKVIEVLKETDNPLRALEEHRIDEEKNVAVIAPYQLNELDRKILPEKYEEVGLFLDEENELPEFKVFNSSNSLVQALKENIERVGPENAGVVVDPSSGYQSLLESTLTSSDIPFLKQKDLSEDNDLRTFLSLVRTGLSSQRVRVKDIRPVLQELNVPISAVESEKFVSDLQSGELEEFREFFTMMEHLPFKEVIRKYEEFTGKGLQSVREIVDELDFQDEMVSEQRLNRIEYYLDSFAPSEEIEEDGVLFADPSKVSRVDRPVVFFVGMDQEWRQEPENMKWVDTEEREKENIRDFKSLLQSGKPVYMVQDKEMNEDIKPCFYLNEILDRDFVNFRELPHKRVRPEEEEEGTGFEREPLEVEKKEVKTLSQSSLNNFAMSPRFYYVSELVSDADEEALEKGNLFHDYAEFYVNYPDFMDEKGDEEVVTFMLESIRPFADDLDIEKLETEFRIGVKNIRNYVETRDISRDEIDGYEKRREENVFAEKFDRPIRSKITEMWFEDEDLGGHGKVDFIQDKSNLVDYKSGRGKSEKKVVKQSKVALHEDEQYPNFQAPMYLAYHRKQVPDQKLSFTFFHFLDNLGDEVTGEAEMDDNIVKVTYYPEEFSEKVSSNEAFELLIKDVAKSNDRRKTLEKLGCHQFKQFMEEN
ncbi:MAG: PD-(D/E)XK nuclease family protein, partial [Candidatus Nanohalobium sp.]